MTRVTAEPFRLLYVCQANQCRSVMAEHLLRQLSSAVPDISAWEIASAGVTARDGVAQHPLVADILAESRAATRSIADVLEVDNKIELPFRSRRLRSSMISESDLILTAERSHRAAVVVMDPSAVDRVFTMRQFARLVDRAGEEGRVSGHALVERAIAHRGLDEPLDGSTDDIADPIGQDARTFRRCADDIVDTFRAFGIRTNRQATIPRQRQAGIFRKFRSRTA